MKYLWGVGLGKDPVLSASAGTVTLSDSGSHKNVESKNVELIVNISQNIVLYNRNNPDLNATFTGGGTTDTVVHLSEEGTCVPSEYHQGVDCSQGTSGAPGPDCNAMGGQCEWIVGSIGQYSDLLHVWVEISDGRSGIDFLSELAVKDRTYAAIKNTDITLEAETLNIDLTSTNAELVNLQQRTGGTASSTGDASVIGLLRSNQATLNALIAIPEQAYFAFGGNIRSSFGIVGINLAAYGLDLTGGDYAVVIRALSDDVEVSLGSQSQFDSVQGGTATCLSGGCDGFTGDLMHRYALPKDDFLETKAKMIQIYDASITGPTGAAGTIAQVTTVKIS